MKNLRALALLLFAVMLSAASLYADNLKQSFSSTFGPTYPSSTAGEAEGWAYINMSRESGTANIFYGERAIYLSTPVSAAENVWGRIMSPEKTGGVGLVTFWAKIRYAITNEQLPEVKLNIETSEDGETFTLEGSVMIPANSPNYKRYSVMVNAAAAKYVRIVAPHTSTYAADGYSNSVNINIDEIIITDSPGADISQSGSIRGEANVSTPNTVRVQGTAVKSNVTFTIDNESVAFSLPGGSTTLTPAQLNAGYDLVVNFNPSVTDEVGGFMLADGDEFPDLILPLSGTGLHRNVAEGFNATISTSLGTYTYLGWQIKNGGRTDKAMYTMEGAGALRIYETLISPPKVGGIGEVSFWYRSESPVFPVEFTVSSSEDGNSWTAIETITTASTEYINYHRAFDDDDVQFIKIEIAEPVSTKLLIIDNYVITENGKKIALAKAAKSNFEFASLPVTKQIPITFASIASDVAISTNQEAFTLGKATLTPAEAAGTYMLSVTLGSLEEGVDFISGTITISEGGLDFPVTVPINFYRERESAYSDFDAPWGGTSASNYYTDQGWEVLNGYRYTTASNQLFGTGANIQLNMNSSLISPPLKSGIGSIQFFTKLGSTGNTVNIHVRLSDDGIVWRDKEVIFVGNSTYQVFEVEINEANAKYVRLDTESISTYTPYIYFENYTITKNGEALAKVVFEEEPYFESRRGIEKTVDVKIAGEAITSDIEVSLKSGIDFSLKTITTIPAAEINGKTYSLPVSFNPAENVYAADTLVLSGPSFNFDKEFPIGGYMLKDLLYEDFNSNFSSVTGVSNTYTVNGWWMWKASRLASAYEGSGVTFATNSQDENPVLISPPKSGGVGIIQFYYRNNTNNSTPEFIVRTYKAKDGEPTVVATLNPVYDNPNPFALCEIEVNDPDARYVEFVMKKTTGTGTNEQIQVDDIIITACNKLIPIISVTEEVNMGSYPGEPVSKTFEAEFANVEEPVALSLYNGESFAIDITEFTPTAENNKATVKVTYTPAEGTAFTPDTVLLKGDGLLKMLKIPVSGIILEQNIYQDFNSVWGTTTQGSYTVDGWKLREASRNTSGQFFQSQPPAGAQMRVSATVKGSLTSPEKIAGIDSLKMSYICSANDVFIHVEVSEDGEDWTQAIEPITTPRNTHTKLAEEINAPTARFLRIRIDTESTSTANLYVDDIEILGMPYLRKIGGELEPIETHASPITIPIQITGALEADANLSMAGLGGNFTLSQTTITPEELQADEEAEKDGIVNLTLTFSASESGTYDDAIFITDSENSDKYYLTIPVTVVYSKPYVELMNTVEPVETNIVPYTIPISVGGLIIEDVEISIDGDDAAHFALSATAITPENLEDGFDFNVVFDAQESSEYAATIHITGDAGEYLSIPLEVAYAKPYVVLLADVEPVETSIVPLSIPISVGGLVVNDMTLSLTGDNAADFSLSATTLTMAEVNGGANFSVAFTAGSSGEYKANVLVSDEDNDYLTIPLQVDYLKPYVELAEPLNPVQASSSPVVIPVSVKGFLLEEATISLKGGKTSYFELSSATISPEDLEEGYEFSLAFNSMEPGAYAIHIHIADKDNVDYAVIPLTVNYTPSYGNGEILLAHCDFESNESFMDWKTFDLDGKVLSLFFNEAKPWYWAYELQTEVPESNSVMAATSMFASNQPDYVTPADDWLFSMPLTIPAAGSYGAAWDARSLMADWLETYEVRVIVDGVLTELEDEFNDKEPALSDASAALVESSDLIYTVNKENATWTERKINLDAYKGKTVRVVWRYISAEQHTVYVDNFKYYSEIIGTHIISTPDMAYTQVPLFTLADHSPALAATVNNGGTDALSNLKVVVRIHDANDGELYSQETGIASLAVNQSMTIESENGYEELAGAHYYVVEVQGGGYSNQITTDLFAGFEATEETYAYDNGDITGGVYSNSAGFELGQKYPIEVDSYVKSITFALTSSTQATSVNINVYEMVGEKMELKQTKKEFAVTQGQDKVYTAELDEKLKLEGGKTYFVAFEQNDGEALYLARTSNEIGSIAAFYTTSNANWTWLGSDHTLYIRLNADSWGVGIDNVESDSNVQVFASQGMLRIKNAEAGELFTVYNIQGKSVMNGKVESHDDTLALSIPKGVYIVRLGNRSYKIMN